MFTTINDFIAEWTKETELTMRVLDKLTDGSLSQPIGGSYRTLGEIAWHLVLSVGYMASMGLAFEGPKYEHAPLSADIIKEEYRRISDELSHAVRAQWSNAMLSEGMMLHGEEWRNGVSLHFTILHQAHHRGQMTVLMRQHGLRVPEIYGPTYDDWIDKGVEPLV